MKKLIKTYFQILSRIAPRLAAHHAFELFQIPINNKIRKKEMSFYSDYTPIVLEHQLEPIKIYELGPDSGDMVFMVHGWESNAASLSSIGKALAAKGLRVILFNLPGHGHSKIKKTNLRKCMEVLHAVIAYYQPQKPVSFVTHSFGSLVTSYALSKIDIKVNQIIMLTAPNHSMDVFNFYKQTIGLGKKAFDYLVKKADNILNEPLSSVSVENFSKKIDYESLTIIHDPKDRIVSLEDSKIIESIWKRSELLLIENSGHYKMLWDSRVTEMVLNQFSVVSK